MTTSSIPKTPYPASADETLRIDWRNLHLERLVSKNMLLRKIFETTESSIYIYICISIYLELYIYCAPNIASFLYGKSEYRISIHQKPVCYYWTSSNHGGYSFRIIAWRLKIRKIHWNDFLILFYKWWKSACKKKLKKMMKVMEPFTSKGCELATGNAEPSQGLAGSLCL